jgi:hypothetical protein
MPPATHQKRLKSLNGGGAADKEYREATMRRILAVTAMILAGAISPAAAQQGAKADAPPTFQPEPFWPKPLPENGNPGSGRRHRGLAG